MKPRTLDVSVVEYGEGIAEVKASAGDDQLGGDDFEQLIVRWALESIGKKIGTIELDDFQHLVLSEAARQAKVELSSRSETTIFLPGFVQTSLGTTNLDLRLDRATFETLAKPLFDRAEEVLRQALRDSGFSSARAPKLLLIGGTGRIPRIRKMLKEAVGVEIITGLDPESGVCEGACILAGIFNGSCKDFLLLDVTPASYSVGLLGDVASVLIPRNSTIPTKKTASFTTTEDNQTELTVRIFQGERPLTNQNIYVGQVRLTGLPSAKSGTPAIEVCFDIDAHGTLFVSATDRATGGNVAAVLESPYRLNPAQLKVLQRKVQKEIGSLRDAESTRRNAEAEAEARTGAARFSETIAKFVQEFGDRVPNESKGLLNSGRLLVGEYLLANASVGDISVLAASLRSTFEETVFSLVVRELKSIGESPGFVEWQRSTSSKRSKCDVVSAIDELKEIVRVPLTLIASLLRKAESQSVVQKLGGTHQGTLDPVSIFILAQFFEFRLTAVHIDIVGNSNRELLRILILDHLARPSRYRFGLTAGQALRDEFKGTTCLFLMEYLSPKIDPDLRSAVEDCLRQMPLGAWRKAWRECDYGPEFIEKNTIAKQEIGREIVETLRTAANPGLQLVAVDDLQKVGVDICGSAIAEIVNRPIDLNVKVRLLSLLGEWKQPEAIDFLFQAVADEEIEASRVALSALQRRQSELPSELVSLFKVANRVVSNSTRPTWGERIALWRLGRSHKSLRNVIRFLVRNR